MVNTYVPKFTYIIPFRFRQDRILPLRRIVEWLSGFQFVEILIVEQDKHSKIEYLNLKATHIFVKSEAPFNKSWAYNIGIKRSKAPVIICGDADFLMDPMEMIESLKLMETYDCIIPTDKAVNLTQQESSLDTLGIFKLKNYVPKRNILDGISIFKREALNKIAGWNEDMIGVAFENEFNELKIKKYLNFKQLSYIGYHLFHFPEITPQPLIERNKQIFDLYKNDTNLLDQHIFQTMPKIGTLNRFASIV